MLLKTEPRQRLTPKDFVYIEVNDSHKLYIKMKHVN